MVTMRLPRLLVLTFMVSLAQATCINDGPVRQQAAESSPKTLVNPLLGPFEGAPGVNATYDYVVVGGGTAGITIASRLVQSGFYVAVVEAGEYYESESFASVPGADVLGVGSSPSTSSKIDWGFVARDVPGAGHRDIHYPRGKCFGGSSALNFMMYQRPSRESMQLWAQLVNDTSYEFDEVFPLFKRTVEFTPPNNKARGKDASAEYDPTAFESSGNPLHVSFPRYAQPFSAWMSRGMQAIGINSTQSFNTGSLFGSQYCTTTIRPKDETRSSSEAAFFKSGLWLRGLLVYRSTLAKKILFDSNRTATGVESAYAGQSFVLTASQEVILAAGAFQSPQLLMVSGVGPSDILNEHGISIVADLPGVGQNMMDHVFFGPSYRVKVETLTKLATNHLYLLSQVSRYELLHAGPLTSPVSDFMAFEKIPASDRTGFSPTTESNLSLLPEDWPEAEYISGAGYVGNFSDPFKSQPRDGFEYATILGTLIAPTSRGNVTITSADTQDLPVINPNWLATETDQQLAVAIYKRTREAFRSAAMAPVIIGNEYFPGDQVRTDEEILEVIRQTVMTIYHASCTCKMGTRQDRMAVVDSRARVFGVQQLRVVDASAFPILPPGHPQSVVYMLAEKIASDIIASSD